MGIKHSEQQSTLRGPMSGQPAKSRLRETLQSNGLDSSTNKMKGKERDEGRTCGLKEVKYVGFFLRGQD